VLHHQERLPGKKGSQVRSLLFGCLSREKLSGRGPKLVGTLARQGYPDDLQEEVPHPEIFIMSVAHAKKEGENHYQG